ncbi:Serine/threonine kinase [Serendipita sp. 407]|nr:Serine/threonine kinase [Serendipita sp. 407]
MQSRREGSPSRSLPRRRDPEIRTEFIRIEGAVDGDEMRDNSSLIANTPGSTPGGTPCGKRLRNGDDARDDEDRIFPFVPKVRATAQRKSPERRGGFTTSRFLEAERRAKEAIMQLREEAESSILERDDEIKRLREEMEHLKRQVEGLQTEVKELREERQDLLLAKGTLADKLWRVVENKGSTSEPGGKALCKIEEEPSVLPFISLPNDVVPGEEVLEFPPLLVEGDRIQIGEFTIRCDNLLGKGGQGKVIAGSMIRGQLQTSCAQVALKQFQKQSDPDIDEAFFREIRALRALHSHGLCPGFVAALETDTSFIIIMEKEVTTLWDLEQHLVALPHYQGGLPISMVREMAHEITLLVAKLHRLGWVHRDIKPDNILVTRKGRLILSDMGVAGLESSIFDGYCGTVGFTAPEVANKRVNKTKQGIDMWALGATILWLAGSVRQSYGPVITF